MVHLPGEPNVDPSAVLFTPREQWNVIFLFPQEAGLTMAECFGTSDALRYKVTSLVEDWHLWVFQYCTQWGYLTVRLLYSCCRGTGSPSILERLHRREASRHHLTVAGRRLRAQDLRVGLPPEKHYAVLHYQMSRP